MAIRVYATPRELNDEDLRGCNAVVVDVLRTSSTIIWALANGAREIIPVVTPAEAGELASKIGRGLSLMCGEREGKKIEGFDLGNSPSEFTEEKVNGRIIVFASTNGAPTIVRCKSADSVVVAGFNNFSPVVERLGAEEKDIAIVCSGKSGKFSIEDFLCAGMYVVALEAHLDKSLVANDASWAAVDLFHRHADRMDEVLRDSHHGQFLVSLGFQDDLRICAEVDSHRVLPILVEGKIRGFKPDGSPLLEAAITSA